MILVGLQMRCRWRLGERGGWVFKVLTQWDSPLTELPSPLGEEERERPFSVFSELEPFWLWWSANAAELEEVAEVAEGLAFSLKSVMMTVRSPTVTSKCWALLRSMFFSLGLIFLWLFFLSGGSLSLFSFSTLSFFSFLGCEGNTNCCVTCCWETSWETGRGFLVDVPFLTSHIMHLKASAVFLYVHTLQSQNPSSEEGFGWRFGLVGLLLSPMPDWGLSGGAETSRSLVISKNSCREAMRLCRSASSCRGN